MVKDLLKVASDDSFFENEHIVYLADKFRGLLLKKYYDNARKPIPDVNYQTVNIALEPYNDCGDICGSIPVLRSKEKIPNFLGIGAIIVYPSKCFFLGEINYVLFNRFKYIGENKYTKNSIYATLGPDGYIYVKSNNSQFMFLKAVTIRGLFQSPEELAKIDCDCTNDCEVLDLEFPLETALIPELIEYIVKELSTGLYKGHDKTNNASDDLSDIAAFVRQNMKDRYLKEYQD